MLAKASSTVNIYQASISMKEFGKLDDAAHVAILLMESAGIRP